MTVKQLKELLNKYPDDMWIYGWDGNYVHNIAIDEGLIDEGSNDVVLPECLDEEDWADEGANYKEYTPCLIIPIYDD